MTKPQTPDGRRSFLSHIGLGAAFIGAGLAAGQAAAKPVTPAKAGFKPTRHKEDAWMDAPTAGHRIVIDSASAGAGGSALLYAGNNFLFNTTGYGLAVKDLAVIVVLRHLSTPFGYADAMWAKYGEGFSKLMDFADPKTKEAPKLNLYNAAGYGEELNNSGVTISSLAARNVQFAICAAATQYIAGAIAKSTGGASADIFKELTANLIPNAHLVSAGVVAVNRAQEYGYTLLTAV